MSRLLSISEPQNYTRCDLWERGDPLMLAYHDTEWGVPCYDDQALFERLMLECFQAGLSWRLILHRRAAFRRAFANFDAVHIAQYGEADVARLMADATIIRNRAKINATITNAQAFLAVQTRYGSFDHFLWRLTDGVPLQKPAPRSAAEIPATTPLSDTLAHECKQHGFRFTGSTVCYALMQSIGMVNDHLAHCFCATQAMPPANDAAS